MIISDFRHSSFTLNKQVDVLNYQPDPFQLD